MTDIVLTATAIAALDALVSLPEVNFFGDLRIDTTIEESYEDTLEVTEHPVEEGAAITDHSFKRPMQLVLRCGWSDSNPLAAINAFNSLFSGGSAAGLNYVDGVYSELLALQESRTPFEVSTGLRLYDSMLITSLFVRRDQRTRFALRVEATLQQVIIVSTQTATIPPQASQATPASTAEVVSGGAQQSTAGSPAPGGALPSDQWTDLSLVSR